MCRRRYQAEDARDGWPSAPRSSGTVRAQQSTDNAVKSRKALEAPAQVKPGSCPTGHVSAGHGVYGVQIPTAPPIEGSDQPARRSGPYVCLCVESLPENPHNAWGVSTPARQQEVVDSIPLFAMGAAGNTISAIACVCQAGGGSGPVRAATRLPSVFQELSYTLYEHF